MLKISRNRESAFLFDRAVQRQTQAKVIKSLGWVDVGCFRVE